MDERTCVHCGAAFQLTTPNRIYCSRQCNKAAERARKKADPEQLYPMICARCGSEFRSWSKKSTLCSQECINAALSERNRSDRSCRSCGVWPGPGRTVCETCRSSRWLQAEAKLAKAAEGTQRAKGRWTVGVCICGSWFTSMANGVLTCSHLCHRRKGRRTRRATYGVNYNRKRTRMTGARYEPINRRTVFDRDGWICKLCLSPTQRSAKVPHPLAPTIDHVVPVALGGDHTYANVQCAHFECNWRKADGPAPRPEQLRLVD